MIRMLTPVPHPARGPNTHSGPRRRIRNRVVLRACGLAGAVGSLMLLAGCAQSHASGVARIRAAKRAESIEYVIGTWSATEKPRVARLERAGRFIDGNMKRHERRLARDLDCAKWWWQRDVDRAPERRERYGEALGRILGGKPDRIERIAILMFY